MVALAVLATGAPARAATEASNPTEELRRVDGIPTRARASQASGDAASSCLLFFFLRLLRGSLQGSY